MRIPRLLFTRLTNVPKWTCANNHRQWSAIASPSSSMRNEQNLPRLELALKQASQMVNNATYSSSLRCLIDEEVSVITQILDKLVGTNSPLSEVEKLGETDIHGAQLLRGILCLLISRIGNEQQKLYQTEQKKIDTIQSQVVVAKVVEMIQMAIVTHNKISNVDSNSIALTELGSMKHLTNKVSVLCGDFFWAKAWKDLADLYQIEVTDNMTTVLINASLGQFVLEEELNDLNQKLNLEYWLEKNFLLSSSLLAFGCKSVLKLADVDESMQNVGYQFGQNLSYFLKAYDEIQWFINESPKSNDVLDFCSLPVVLHTMETGDTMENVQKKIAKFDDNSSRLHESNAKNYDYEQLHSIIRMGPGIAKSKTILQMFRASAFTNLNRFPPSDARDCVKNILDAMYI
ncbi:Decaprenyl-diphosphate synthase subunit 2 [Blomia tropicalis]|nr:Decaprenyl-diphosphate synthase subunit 2 [Blomia tropicalis]